MIEAKTFEKFVRARFPQIDSIEVEHFSRNIRPVEERLDGKTYTEYPPVIRWRIGQQRFAFVPKPSANVRRSGVLFWEFRDIEFNYNGQDDVLIKVLQMSVDGKTTDEINQYIRSME